MIPKKIHYCWVGGNPLPDSAKKCIKSWKKHCPDYEIIEWNETNYDFTKIPYMKEAYEAKKWGFVPDYARLDVIYNHGGIYLDTDVEVIKAFDTMLDCKGFAGFESRENVNFGQGFGAEAHNPVIKKLMDSYLDMHFADENGELNLTPSPRLNTEVLVGLGLKKDGSMQEIEGFKVFPAEYFCPRVGYGGARHLTKNTYSDHHFNASWAEEEDKRKWAKTNQMIDRINRREYLRFLPNRIGKKLLGNHYETLKKWIKGN